MEKKRARRRRELRRMKAKALWIFSRYHRNDVNQRDIRLANHLAVCSSWCCGNPRRWSGELTMQERRFEAAWVTDKSED